MFLYSTLLAGTPVLPAAVLRAALADAQTNRDHDLLADLAGRGDLPDDVRDALEFVGHPSVVAARRARPEVPGAESARAPERRSSVLAKAVGRYGTPDAAAFADAIACYVDKPTATLFKVLWPRPAHWYTPEQAAALVIGLDRSDNLRDSREAAQAMIARLGPDLGSRVVDRVDSPVLLAWLTDFDLGDDTLVAALARIVADKNARHMFDLVSLTWRVFARISLPRQPMAIADLAAAARTQGPERVEVVRRATQRGGTPPKPLAWDTRSAEPPRVATDLASAPELTVRTAAASADPGILAQVVDRVIAEFGRPDVTDHIVQALVRNPALGTGDLHRLMRAMRELSPIQLLMSNTRQVDATLLHPGDEVVADTWTHLFAWELLKSRGWEPFGGPTTAGTWVRRWEDDLRAGRRREEVIGMIRSAAALGLSDTDTASLRPDTLNRVMGRSDKGGAVLADQVARILADHLGDDPQMWATFHMLTPTFEGSLADLLTTAKAVTAA